MNGQVSVVVRVVAESLAASVARVDPHRVSAKKVNVSHVSHQPLAREKRTVANLALEVTRQHMRCFVLQQRRTVHRPELAVAAVVSALPVGILWAVEANVLAEVSIEHAAVWTDTLHREREHKQNTYCYKL